MTEENITMVKKQTFVMLLHKNVYEACANVFEKARKEALGYLFDAMGRF